MTNGFDIFIAYDEVRNTIASNTNNSQNYTLPLRKIGGEDKDGVTLTPKYGELKSGWRLVPYPSVSHKLRLLIEIISLDGLTDRDCFDRSGVTVEVDIDKDYEQVEIILVNTGGGGGSFTEDDRNALNALSPLINDVVSNIAQLHDITAQEVYEVINDNFYSSNKYQYLNNQFTKVISDVAKIDIEIPESFNSTDRDRVIAINDALTTLSS